MTNCRPSSMSVKDRLPWAMEGFFWETGTDAALSASILWMDGSYGTWPEMIADSLWESGSCGSWSEEKQLL